MATKHYLEKYLKLKNELNCATEWRNRKNDKDCDGKTIGKWHNINADPVINVQYYSGGKNYWKCSEEAGRNFTEKLNAAIQKHLPTLIDEALVLLKSEIAEAKEQAKEEYLSLFNDDANITEIK